MARGCGLIALIVGGLFVLTVAMVPTFAISDGEALPIGMLLVFLAIVLALLAIGALLRRRTWMGDVGMTLMVSGGWAFVTAVYLWAADSDPAFRELMAKQGATIDWVTWPGVLASAAIVALGWWMWSNRHRDNDGGTPGDA